MCAHRTEAGRVHPSPSAVAFYGHGNTTQMGTQSWTYDAADRVTSASTAGITPTQTLTYGRDPLGRVATRTATGPEAGTVRYAFTNTGDSPDVQLTAGGAIGERYLPLPGGVLHRKGYAVNSTVTWSVTNLHGDVIATLTGTTLTAGYIYDPYGQPLGVSTGEVDTAATPTTRTGTGTTDAWAGHYQRGYEHTGGLNQILMGARTYLPALGIFTATDPIPGGNTTTYTYPQDPINSQDLSGTMQCVDCGGGTLDLKPSKTSTKTVQTKSDGRYHGPVTSPQLTLNGVWAAVRIVINAPTTAVGTTWAVMNGASCKLYSEGLVGCTGASGGFGRGGTTIGNTFITAQDPDLLEQDSRLRAHELKHADQWALLGGTLPFLYFGMEVRYSGAANPFEIWAGLRDGHYVR